VIRVRHLLEISFLHGERDNKEGGGERENFSYVARKRGRRGEEKGQSEKRRKKQSLYLTGGKKEKREGGKKNLLTVHRWSVVERKR